MRRTLDTLYLASALAAAAATISIALLIFVQVGGRMLGYGIRGVDDVVAWLTAWACVAGTGYAFRCGSHVRVDLVVERLSGRARYRVGILAALVGWVIALYATYAMGLMVVDSYRFNDLSQGDIPVPLWIPQMGVAFGMAVLLVAVSEALFDGVRGGPRPAQKSDLHSPVEL